MGKVLRRKCYQCEQVFDVIPWEVYFSKEAKDGGGYIRGVRFVEDAFASEIYGDETKHWQCNNCWWQGWWDI